MFQSDFVLFILFPQPHEDDMFEVKSHAIPKCDV